MKKQYICDSLSSFKASQERFLESGHVLLWEKGKPVTQTNYWLPPPLAHIVVKDGLQGLRLDEGRRLLVPPMFEEIMATYYTAEGYFSRGIRTHYLSLVFREGNQYGLASALAYQRGREDKILLTPAVYDEIHQIPWADCSYMLRLQDKWSIYTLQRARYLDGTDSLLDMAVELCPFEIKEFVGSITLGSGEDDYTYEIWGLKSAWGYWGAFMTAPQMYIPPIFDNLSISGEEDDEYIVGWFEGMPCIFPRDECQYILLRKYTKQYPMLNQRYEQLRGMMLRTAVSPSIVE